VDKREKNTIYKLRQKVLKDQFIHTLIPIFQPPELEDNKFKLLKLISLWYFPMTD
jgi:hypothetical protein